MADFTTGLMGRMRQSSNVQTGTEDVLLRRLLGEQAYLSDDEQAALGRSALTPDQRQTAFDLLNTIKPYVNQGSDPLGVGRQEVLGPGGPQRPTPDMLRGLLAGGALQAPSFRQMSDDALFAQGISDLLAGTGDRVAPGQRQLEQIGGPLDEATIARLYGVLMPSDFGDRR